MTCQKGRHQKIKRVTKANAMENDVDRVLMNAQSLIDAGVDAKVVQEILKRKEKS